MFILVLPLLFKIFYNVYYVFIEDCKVNREFDTEWKRLII
ncbi:hypothetical protein Cst_c16130 [Thermoclostridium stercorarium subsp. stercorarium DSM 8532]|uniref:Uncharacterized protein n=1 Tax=Thermoclostridium stercorarium (strain ATCC 35414 / DSM 8532 / NCIMB 11754) TaxID=1121335 RepID=L7VPK2_THES1|nr:hypothetical protein Cst_c16130 [Thermoclostridium stercorarium subsp. stercorarium DSM 8532]